jgi:hypothetical protein
MGTRGPRSAADLASYRPNRELTAIDFEAFARQFGDRREALRALRRAERQGSVISRMTPEGGLEWYGT